MRINRPPGPEVVVLKPPFRPFLPPQDEYRRLRFGITLVTFLPSHTSGIKVLPLLVASLHVLSLLLALEAGGLWLPARVPSPPIIGATRRPHRHLCLRATATIALGAYRLRRQVCPLRVGELKAQTADLSISKQCTVIPQRM
jgi:hypothetical protein